MLPASIPFAVMTVEREPPKFADLPRAVTTWVQDVGVIAGLCLVIWLIAYVLRRPEAGRPARPRWFRWVFTLALAGAALGYGFVLVTKAPIWFRNLAAAAEGAPPLFASPTLVRQQATALVAAGACAILAAGLPFLADLFRLRWRRIWALARLSFKEAIRRRVLWAFLFLLLVFLFGSWFLPHKPEDQVRSYVHVVYWAMTPLLLVSAGLLAAFSLPTDVRNQAIHTIVTKPVERFEIVLGRFLGYVLLLTLVLAVMTAASYLYVYREIEPEAVEESLRARVPVYGDLQMVDIRGRDYQGHSVGREFGYRTYLAGGTNSPERAVWGFAELPSGLDARDQVRCEFAFDIFRTTTGTENQGVLCSLFFKTRHCTPEREQQWRAERDRAAAQPDREPDAVLYNRLAEEYGYFEFPLKEVVDYHTFAIDVPAGLFRNAARPDPAGDPPAGPPVRVEVKCESRTQYLGVAKHDLYLLDGEGWFAANFFKGALGLWMRLCLIVGVAVACSTYLNGVISFLCTMFLFVGGYFKDWIHGVALGQNEGGGPTESLVRLLSGQTSTAMPLDPGATASVVGVTDEGFRWLLRQFLNVLPDVDRYDLSTYVAEGFNIPAATTGLDLLLLVGYLLPWAVLAYYLIKSREIATW